MKNEYHRALIMLRPIVPGYSGHVRWERRTLMGSMYFMVQAPENQGELLAMLTGEKKDQRYAAKLGPLRRDGRGQATLAYGFDPRSIDGRPLEDYDRVMIVQKEESECRVVLAGNLNGSTRTDFDGAQAVACELLSEGEMPAWELFEPSESEMENEPEIQLSDALQDGFEDAGDVDQDNESSEGETAAPEADENERSSGPLNALADDAVDTGAVAAQRLEGIDIQQPWGSVLEGVRQYFATLPSVQVDLPGNFVYVQAPMPEGSGYPHVLIGLLVRNGQIQAVRYALPGAYAPQAPVGLENYTFQTGDNGQWWVLTVDPKTGNPLPETTISETEPNNELAAR